MRFIVPVVLLCVLGCSSPTVNKRSVYFWKTTYQFSSSEDSSLKALAIEKLYLRLFDVNWDQQKAQSIPVGIINFDRKALAMEHVPVVYITQSAINNESEPILLADKISRLVSSIALKNQFSFKELQLDCDWTDQSKAAYFALLKKVKENFPGIAISATIRLHQIKYQLRSGIPPVDRGMLMYYNMGELQGPLEQNSIFEEKIAERYNDYLKNYPLQLDLVLPAFDWIVKYSKGGVSDLLSNTSLSDLNDQIFFEPLQKGLWRVKQGHYRNGTYFNKNDLLKHESIEPKTGLAAASLANEYLADASRSVALFSWNDFLRRNYDTQQIDGIYRACDK